MSFQLVPLQVCGQQLEASMQRHQGLQSLQVLKETVTDRLGMQQDWIEFFDSNGTKLLTDHEVSTAISEGRTPIYGAMADHSVHNFEQRREEFAHIQWKVLRDQFTVLNLQLAQAKDQLKSVEQEMERKENANVKKMASMMNQLADGLQIMQDCKRSQTHMEECVRNLNENVQSMGMKLHEESANRNSAMQDVHFKVDRLKEAQQHEIERLANGFDACISLLQQADEKLERDVHELEKKIESTRDLANANHEDALKQVAEARIMATQAIGEASFAMLNEAHEDAENQFRNLATVMDNIEIRVVNGESLSSDTARRWQASHEQMKEHYNSLSQAVEQCRLQNRTNQASTQDVKDKLGANVEAVHEQLTTMKAEQARERKDRQEQLRSFLHNFDGTLTSTLLQLETKLYSRIDQEADARTTSILQAIDDISIVLEKKIPTKIRSRINAEVAKMGTTGSARGLLDANQGTKALGESVPWTPRSIQTAASTTPGTSESVQWTPRSGQTLTSNASGTPSESLRSNASGTLIENVQLTPRTIQTATTNTPGTGTATPRQCPTTPRNAIDIRTCISPQHSSVYCSPYANSSAYSSIAATHVPGGQQPQVAPQPQRQLQPQSQRSQSPVHGSTMVDHGRPCNQSPVQVRPVPAENMSQMSHMPQQEQLYEL